MPAVKDAPSQKRFSHFYCEESTVTSVNVQTWTCTVQTKYSAKTHSDVQWSSPYHHPTGGEGVHYVPEIGAHCYIAVPVDGTPPFVMGFIAPPAVLTSADEKPVRSTDDAGGSPSNVTYQSNRPDLNPGDIAITTRDGNFFILRRGGVVQLGATALAQRVMVPVRNFIHDFAENYELATPAGDVTWLVDRPELDDAGKPACSYTFHMQEFATDKKATVRIRHLPLSDAGGTKAAWEVTVAKNGIDRNTGAVSAEVYTLSVLTTGAVSEFIGARRSVEVKSDDKLVVGGNRTVEVKGDSIETAKNLTLKASNTVVVEGEVLRLGDGYAMEPGLLGSAFAQWLSTVQILVPQGPPGSVATGMISPASLAQFQKTLSKKTFLK